MRTALFARLLRSVANKRHLSDSVTENHFFSLSCLLYPHVRATPDYVANPYFDRGWPQNLYLDPASPLISKIKFPDGFDIETTPLVTFRRIDLLFEPSALDALYKQLHPDSALATQGGNLFSDEATWNLAPAEYVKIFTAPLPRGNYATMVVSTGGHWTTTLFAGLKDAELPKDGIENVVGFFGEAMDAWAGEVQALLYAAEKEERATRGFNRKGRPPRQVVARAYLPGHEDCHDHRVPDKEYKPGRWGWYNWNQIGDFNKKFEVRSFFIDGGGADGVDTVFCRRCSRGTSTPTSTSCRSTALRCSGRMRTRRATVYTS